MTKEEINFIYNNLLEIIDIKFGMNNDYCITVHFGTGNYINITIRTKNEEQYKTDICLIKNLTGK